MALANADRCSDLGALDLSHRSYVTNGVRFVIPSLTKLRRNGPPIDPLFPEDQHLCPVQTSRAYEERSRSARTVGEENPLFISVRRPFHPVKAATIGHWLKSIMSVAGDCPWLL